MRIPINIPLGDRTKNGLSIGLPLLIMFIIQVSVVPHYTGIQMTPMFLFFIFVASMILGGIFFGIGKKKIFFGIFPLVFSTYFMIYGLVGLVGGMNIQGVSIIDFTPYNMEQQWQLTERAIIIFAVFIIGGGIAFRYSFQQFMESFTFIGWR